MVIFEEPGILRIGSRKVCEQDVEVSIADTGTGIGDEHVDRLFNPLYTTKSEGLGMGLSICRSIIESHNGRLWVELNKPRVFLAARGFARADRRVGLRAPGWCPEFRSRIIWSNDQLNCSARLLPVV